MANNKSAIKRWHQSIRRRDRNRSRRSAARTATRQFRETIVDGDPTTVQASLGQAYSALDLAAKSGAIHSGKADRQKRRLAAAMRKAAAGS